ncbi:uncharacterized protein [Asterias amurensis]|uniref:uncharacterized protein isoform X2 n=1 Tax=Asterias amurensis TaxID=7602 RepID=UPI003AB65750
MTQFQNAPRKDVVELPRCFSCDGKSTLSLFVSDLHSNLQESDVVELPRCLPLSSHAPEASSPNEASSIFVSDLHSTCKKKMDSGLH